MTLSVLFRTRYVFGLAQRYADDNFRRRSPTTGYGALPVDCRRFFFLLSQLVGVSSGADHDGRGRRRGSASWPTLGVSCCEARWSTLTRTAGTKCCIL